MSISKSHLAWFKLKCPYPPNSHAYKQAFARLNNATYADLEKLRAEFDEYDDWSIPCAPLQAQRSVVRQAALWWHSTEVKHEGYTEAWQEVEGTEA